MDPLLDGKTMIKRILIEEVFGDPKTIIITTYRDYIKNVEKITSNSIKVELE